MKGFDSVKCPSKHVQLLRRKLALLVRKEVHWHGASFVLPFYSAPASCTTYLFIYLFCRKPDFFPPPSRYSVTEWPVIYFHN